MPFQQVCLPGSSSPPFLLHFSLSTPSCQHWAPFLISNLLCTQTRPFMVPQSSASLPSNLKLHCFSVFVQVSPSHILCPVSYLETGGPYQWAKGHQDYQYRKTICLIFGKSRTTWVKCSLAVIHMWRHTNTQMSCERKQCFAPVNSNDTRKIMSGKDIYIWIHSSKKFGIGGWRSWAWTLTKCMD